jgi:EAL domain-containing protein (putative c-di-GMP-specific phosphodiesterase class I)/CheY-like chemotaxis protein
LGLDRTPQSPNVHDATASGPDSAAPPVPVCFIVDEEPKIRHFLSLILHGAGLETEEFGNGESFRQAITRTAPDLVFLDIGIEVVDTIESLVALGKRGYFGFVQLMSTRGDAVLKHVKGIGGQHGLQMLPGLKKPFDTGAINAIMQQLELANAPGQAARVELSEALKNGWIEFWYQPKIDLRRKRLAGAEVFARCRHPDKGVLLPGTFMPDATDIELLILSELAIANVLKGGARLAQLGINMRCAVNIPLSALTKLSVPNLVRAHHKQSEQWAGLIIDVPEEQIAANLALATELTRSLAPLNVSLAIDNFGHGYSSFARLKALPFAELKLDPSFVTNCGTDKVNRPLCRTVIELAHKSDSLAVAIGIEKAADALALTSMGCDIGQGFLLGQPMPEDRFVSLIRQRAAGQGRTLPAAANG